MSKIIKKIISTKTAPQPVAPYRYLLNHGLQLSLEYKKNLFFSQAVVADRTVYVSGCLGLNMDTGKVNTGGAAIEAELALTHLKNVLLASGSNLDNVVKTTVFLQNFDDFQSVNDVYKRGNLIVQKGYRID